MDWLALSLAAGLCVAMAGAEGFLTGKDLPAWLASLTHPPLYAPMWVWVLVAITTYVVQGFIAYRLLSRPMDLATVLALGALIAVMSANVIYNIVLTRTRKPRHAFTGILWALIPLALLQISLLAVDPLSAGLNLIYVTWVVGYDLPIMRSLWLLNK